MRQVTSFLALVGLVACGGSERAFFGGMTAEVDINGNFNGVPASATQVVSKGGNGFAYAFARNLDATVVGSSAGAASGDVGNFGLSGILPGYDVGQPILSGAASLTGEYAFTMITGTEQSPNAGAWKQEEFAGVMTAMISFDRAESDLSDPDDPSTAGDVDVYQNDMILAGQSDDGHLILKRSKIYDLISQRDLSAPSNFSELNLRLNGQSFSPRNEVIAGEDGVIAAFAGSGRNTIVTGGFVLGRSD